MVFGHRPMYCSNPDSDDCITNAKIRVNLEALLNQYNVDVYGGSHEHSFETTLPMYNNIIRSGPDSSQPFKNPTATVHVSSDELI